MRGAFRFRLRACLAAALLASAGAGDAMAAQQKWASQYIKWKSDGKVKEVFHVDQQVWVAKANDRSYWPMQFGFLGLKYGGYMGLQYRSADEQRARFAIWNAIAAEGPNCRPFDNEGEGQTCYIELNKIEPRKFYRLRLVRLETVADGQWWGGWLVTTDSIGKVVQQQIGRIKARPEAKVVNPNSISNFVEYYGPPAAACEQISMSMVAFTPPSFNQAGIATGTYAGSATFAGSKKAKGNICETGKEAAGAFITVLPQTFGQGDGAMLFLGGKPKQHVPDFKAHPIPAALPSN